MRVATATVAACLAMLAPSTALAAGGLPPGVHISPGSPSQHQYVIPLQAARAEANGGHHGGGSGSQLFGSGITSGSSSGGSGGSGGGGSGKSGAQTAALAARHGSKGLHSSSYALASQRHSPTGPASSSNGGSGWVPLVAGGVLVLVLGGGGGLALRRRILRA